MLSLFLAGQQRLDLSPRRCVVAAGVFQERNAAARVEFQRAVIEFFDPSQRSGSMSLSIAQLPHRRWTFTAFQ